MEEVWMSEARPWSRQAMEHGGFTGFVRFAELDPVTIPEAPGVYVVLRGSTEPPVLLDASAAGRVRGKDPSMNPELLRRRWVEGPEVLYVGRTTGRSAGRGGLRKRLDELRRHGAGEPVDHWSGRAVWQLADRDDLLVAWNATEEDPAAVSSRMLDHFVERYGVLPFANLRR